MSKPRYRLLLDKSIQAALSAIELYNKPNFAYREESFSILMVNAWELLLKAKHLKAHNGDIKSLYIPKSVKTKDGKERKRFSYQPNNAGNYRTIGISTLIKKEITDSNLTLQIETLIEIRDNSIHFMNDSKLFEKHLLEIAVATLKSYKEIMREWFNCSLAKYDLFLIPIAFNVPQIFTTELLALESESHKNLLNYIALQNAKRDENSNHDIALEIDIKLARRGKGALVRFDKSGAPLYLDSEDVFKNKYPWDYKKLLLKIKSRYSDFKQNQKFNALKKELSSDKKFCGERYLDYEAMTGSKKSYYSPDILAEFDNHYTLK